MTTDPENGCLHIQSRRALQHFFFFHNSFEQHPGTNIQEAVHSTDFQHTQLGSQYKTGKDNDGLHTYEVLRKNIIVFASCKKSTIDHETTKVTKNSPLQKV